MPDGTGQRTEFIDSLCGRGNYDFAWSPDGNSIAWLRTFPDQSQEIIIHNLKTGHEIQLTSDGKNMDGVCWTANNMIIFSSTKSGNTNIWCIPVDGGKEQQITRGSGPDLGVVVSADCKKLLYYQNQDIGYIWHANSSGTDLKQLTFDNQNVSSISLSPDGQYIVFSSSTDQGFSTLESHLYVMNKDGSNRRQLTFGKEYVNYVAFSPDGKRIAFESHGNLEPADSAKIRLINFPSPGEPRTIRSGNYPWWIDDSTMIVLDLKHLSSWKVPIAGGEGVQMFQDSTYAFPIDNGKYIPYSDAHYAHHGFWLYDEASKTSRLLHSYGTPTIVLPKVGFGYYMKADGSIWKVYLPGGREEKLTGTLPGIKNALSVAFSADGKNIAFINTHSNGRLVMIDNLFK
jgi:dipeptidyl aminopeptidase/acylaminoacyl peptidase